MKIATLVVLALMIVTPTANLSQEPRNGMCPPKLSPQGEHSRVPGTIWNMLAAIGVGTELPP